MPLLTNNTIGKQQIIHIKKGVSKGKLFLFDN